MNKADTVRTRRGVHSARRPAALCSLLLALAAAPDSRAQQPGDQYQNTFSVSDADESGPKGPSSVADAKKEHRGYRLGRNGVHSTSAAEAKGSHVVQQGDTLWDISEHYYGEPWHWPELWSYNPEITNPHWIYPLDQVRLEGGSSAGQPSGGAATQGASALRESATAPGVMMGTEVAPAVIVPRNAWKPGMIFLRDEAYLDKEALPTIGQVVAAQEEHMMLSASDQVYLRFDKPQDVRDGRPYTLFRTVRKFDRAEHEQGTLVKIIGTVVVRRYDPETRVARALITETLEPVERGLMVAKLDRRFDLVAAKRNRANVSARVIATTNPRTLLATGYVVFLDVGEGHGIEPGNRFFAVRRGDDWLRGILAKPTDLGNHDEVPDYDEKSLPKEVIGELRVIKVRKNTTIAIITRSDVDLAIGERVEMRTGF